MLLQNVSKYPEIEKQNCQDAYILKASSLNMIFSTEYAVALGLVLKIRSIKEEQIFPY